MPAKREPTNGTPRSPNAARPRRSGQTGSARVSGAERPKSLFVEVDNCWYTEDFSLSGHDTDLGPPSFQRSVVCVHGRLFNASGLALRSPRGTGLDPACRPSIPLAEDCLWCLPVLRSVRPTISPPLLDLASPPHCSICIASSVSRICQRYVYFVKSDFLIQNLNVTFESGSKVSIIDDLAFAAVCSVAPVSGIAHFSQTAHSSLDRSCLSLTKEHSSIAIRCAPFEFLRRLTFLVNKASGGVATFSMWSSNQAQKFPVYRRLPSKAVHH
jgi:hypothetical protein